MARRKSVNDIMNQFNRIAERSLVQDGNRVSRARIAAFRYYENIRRANGNWNYNDDSSYTKKYARSTYMGLNAG